MPIVTSPPTGHSASFTIFGSDFMPSDAEWLRATDARRRDYWRRVGELAIQAKHRELVAGIDVDGHKLTPVKPSSRKDGATGPPLIPHGGSSRFYFRMRQSLRADGVTVFWGDNWAKVVQAHRVGATIANGFGRGIRIKLPRRDVVGLTVQSQHWVHQRAMSYWGNAAKKYASRRERYNATIRERLQPHTMPPVPTSTNRPVTPMKPPGFWDRVGDWFVRTALNIFARRTGMWGASGK